VGKLPDECVGVAVLRGVGVAVGHRTERDVAVTVRGVDGVDRGDRER